MMCQSLPEELVREILLRLPVRSVLRFKCVCKSWFSLISDPQFGISHYDLAAAPSHRLLFRSNDFYAQSIDLDTPLKIYYRDIAYFPLPLPSPPCVDQFYFRFQNQPEILGSCRGLVILYYKNSNDLILWNPSIGVHKRLKNFEDGITSRFLYGFGYDGLTDDYLLILIALLRLSIDYVNVSYDDLCEILGEDKFKAGSLFNGTLNWLVLSKDYVGPLIIAFDLIQRSFSEIPLLDHLTMGKYLYCLRAIGGCLGVCCSVQDCDTAEIRVMKEYKVQSSWIKTVVLPTSGFSLICITKDGGIFGSNSSRSGGLEKLNDKGELLEDHCYGGDEGLYCANLQSAMYRESLLSSPVSFRKQRKMIMGRQVKMTMGRQVMMTNRLAFPIMTQTPHPPIDFFSDQIIFMLNPTTYLILWNPSTNDYQTLKIT
ncbi:F-box/kelch-repeat protein, partial [Mucuna pruriens]